MFRRCASRPTATLLDAFGIKKMWVMTRSPDFGRAVLDSRILANPATNMFNREPVAGHSTV